MNQHFDATMSISVAKMRFGEVPMDIAAATAAEVASSIGHGDATTSWVAASMGLAVAIKAGVASRNGVHDAIKELAVARISCVATLMSEAPGRCAIVATANPLAVKPFERDDATWRGPCP